MSEDDKYWTEIVNFGHKFVHIPDRFVRQYDRLLVPHGEILMKGEAETLGGGSNRFLGPT